MGKETRKAKQGNAKTESKGDTQSTPKKHTLNTTGMPAATNKIMQKKGAGKTKNQQV